MFDFLKKNNSIELEEKPLEYWEAQSYMVVIPKDSKSYVLDDEAINRVRALEDIEVKEARLPVAEEGRPGLLVLEYEGEEFGLGFYYDHFQMGELYEYQAQFFSEDEMKQMQEADMALTAFMVFHDDAVKSYKLQLKVLNALMPDALAYEDESAEKLLNKRWVELMVTSKADPESSALYSVQAVFDNDTEVWLHTHGLARCGLTELEILNSDREHYNSHYEIISSYASRMLGADYDPDGDYVFLGQYVNGEPIVVTKRMWPEGIKEYDQKILGTAKDREDSHNTRSSIIFLYTSQEDVDRKRIHKVEEMNQLLEDNPIFFLSKYETAKMRDVARERIDYVKRVMDRDDTEEHGVLLKLGLPVDDAENKEELEHIWFQLLEIRGDKFFARLTQEPYNISALHEGDEGEYQLSDLTNWVIYCKEGRITPYTVYLLDLEN
ncbi:MAG: DUF4026 domain-containing protein [Clostridiales bacterium]|nr:DUF4026 domain-containing protein [Clostridiales bacterium]MBS5878049.1 DUF4026 domain-containing protein [Clostridiales bacterium]MDU0939281.1 DUF4026 domain-containing protein [Clostridiales bacterium]MDU1042287.1 DUF4026 domain-containing protein [Clostridiales bacterium]MDU3490106.1 DUF4026 domain-containing protein [Clostridiales bacterium]